jgi:hypothetical protein
MSIERPERRRVKHPIKIDERRKGWSPDAAHQTETNPNELVPTSVFYNQHIPENKHNSPETAPPLPSAVESGRLVGFVPLPSDPEVPLTPEQLDSLFPPANRALLIEN